MQLSLSLMFYRGIHATDVKRLRKTDFAWGEKPVIIRLRVRKTEGGGAVPLRQIEHVPKKDSRIPCDWVGAG